MYGADTFFVAQMVVHRTWDDIAGQEAKMPPQSWGNDGDNVAEQVGTVGPASPRS